jgi:hypothetical protein
LLGAFNIADDKFIYLFVYIYVCMYAFIFCGAGNWTQGLVHAQ